MTAADCHQPSLIAVAVVERRGCFLVGCRVADQTLAGCHEFPGGRAAPGESLDDAAVRECLEETGLRVEVLGEYPPVRHAYEHALVEVHFFHCRPLDEDGEPRPPFEWVARTALATRAFPAANGDLVSRLVRGDERLDAATAHRRGPFA